MYKYIFALLLVIISYSGYSQDKHLLSSLSLKEAIDIAVKYHPELNKSRQNINLTKSRYYRGISLTAPEISYSNEFISGGKTTSADGEKTIEINQKFDFPTTYFARSSRGNSEISASEASYLSSLNYLSSSVKKAYYNALAKKELLKITEENLNITTEFFKKAEIRYNVGEATNLELLTSKMQFTEAKTQIENARKDYKMALSELYNTLGNYENIDIQSITLSDSLSYIPFAMSLEKLKSKYISENPLLKQLGFQVESANISKNLAWMNLIPSFNASYFMQSRDGISSFWGFKVGVSVPLWFMLENRGEINEANANYQIMLSEQRAVMNSLETRINSAYLDFKNDEAQLLLYQKELLPQAEEIFRSADLSYQAGEVSYLEFLQAKLTLINTRSNYIRGLYNYNEAISNLEELTGITLN